jgi:hypothetical protein
MVVVDVPPESQKKLVLEVPFEDAWRASIQAIVQAQFNVESSQKAKGVILGKKIKTYNRGLQGEWVYKTEYTYAVLVNETGPKTTEVRVLSKAQGSCRVHGVGMYALMIVGIITILFIPIFYSESSDCKELISVPHWAGGPENEEQLTQVSSFVRNNLIAAGAL